MAYIVAMQPPSGPVEYLPQGFGFTSHAHTLDIAQAARFPDALSAARRMNAYRFPPSFWEGERRHAASMEKQFKNWKFEVIQCP